jgi:hypothetical protein
MVADAPNGAGPTSARDVELSNQSDSTKQIVEEGNPMDQKEEKKKELPSFFPSHGLTTAGACGARRRRCALCSAGVPTQMAEVGRRACAVPAAVQRACRQAPPPGGIYAPGFVAVGAMRAQPNPSFLPRRLSGGRRWWQAARVAHAATAGAPAWHPGTTITTSCSLWRVH